MDALTESTASMRALIRRGAASPTLFRTAVTSVRPSERDAWLDAVLGLDEIPDDGPALPRGCVPYLPCAVDTLLRMAEQAQVQSSDVFVDVGSGVGRAAALTMLLTGAAAIGIEVQPDLVKASRDLATRLNATRFSVIEGDAAALTGRIDTGTVFFLYCPFGGERLEQALAGLESIARMRPIRVCCVDLPLPPLPWLTPVAPPSRDLAVYRSVAPS